MFRSCLATAAALALLWAPSAAAQQSVPDDVDPNCALNGDGWPWKATTPRAVAAFPSAVVPRADGSILLCGGDKTVGGTTKVCENWDPTAEAWSLFPTDMPGGLAGPIGLELSDGRVLVCQGSDTNTDGVPTVCYLLDDGGTPADGTDDVWMTLAGPPGLNSLARNDYRLDELADGRILIRSDFRDWNSFECRAGVFDIATNTWFVDSCNNNAQAPILLADGSLVVPPTRPGSDRLGESFDTASGWGNIAAPLNFRDDPLAVPSAGNQLLVAGGKIQIWDATIHTRTTEVYDPALDTWEAGLPVPRFIDLRYAKNAALGGDRSLVWYQGSSAGGANSFTGQFLVYHGDTQNWGFTCSLGEYLFNENDNYGDGWQTYSSPPDSGYRSSYQRGPDGRLYMLDYEFQQDNYNPFGEERQLQVYIYDPSVVDADGDSVPDCCDNCPAIPNPLQDDSNSNGLGDLCEVCGDKNLAQPPSPTTELLDLVALEFRRTYPPLARIGSTVEITLEVQTNTFVNAIEIVEAIPAGATLVSAPGSNELTMTNVPASTTLTITYEITVPATQGLIGGQADVTVEPLELGEESFGIPLSILVFRAESCDDGNTIDGDGCSATCQVETGWTCPIDTDDETNARWTPGCLPLCGDGLLVGDETCDDGNNEAFDGCSGRATETDDYPQESCGLQYPDNLTGQCIGCQVEQGWECDTPGEPCTTECGDELTLGDEECDDGNTDNGDGCDSMCQLEDGWNCFGDYDCLRNADNDVIRYYGASVGYRQACGEFFEKSCMPVCGDGMTVGDEECDDSNNSSQDGCAGRNVGQYCAQQYASDMLTTDCTGCYLEPGFECDDTGCAGVCGDGVVVGDETCDDANDDATDGCDACAVTDGWYCGNGTTCDDEGRCSRSTIWCYPVCGDGEVLGDEECDDGNNESGDGCSRRVLSEWCAEELAQADAGDITLDDVNPSCRGCRVETGYGCDATGCSPVCGDGLIVGDETCDDGNTVGNDGCVDCEREDGWFCPADFTCDEFGCFSSTIFCYPQCGDGLVVGDETCDDSNLDWNDGCSGRIMSDWCARSFAQLAAGEITADDVSSGCYGCTDEVCGDGFRQDNEACDDGNTADGDGCASDCTSVEDGFDCFDTQDGSQCRPECGDGLLVGAETCDDGNDNGGDGCDSDCKPEFGFVCDTVGAPCEAICGDGYWVGEEQCDDGNTEDGDGCPSDCGSWEDGWTCQPTEGSYGAQGCCSTETNDFESCELLDDGMDCPDACSDAAPGDVCQWLFIPGGQHVCTPICGDGQVVDPAQEACDDGNLTQGDGCTAGCQVEPGWECGATGTACQPDCGDGMLVVGEFCDDGDTDSGDGCSSQCLPEPGWVCDVAGEDCTAVCGDGLVRGAETCDDNNVEAGDGCSASCDVEPGASCPPGGGGCVSLCGNGELDVGMGMDELCDDGNKTNGDGCSVACEVEDGWECPAAGAVCVTVCGDGIVAGAEFCDDGDADSGDGCSSSCLPEAGWSCVTPGADCAAVCGDGLVRGAELCDDGNTADADGCSAGCTVEDGWQCPSGGGACMLMCGNGVVDDGEDCDDGDANSGDGCSGACEVEAGWACPAGGGVCAQTCGNGAVDAAEDCDDGNTTAGDGCSAGCVLEEGYACPTAGAACTTVCGDGVRVLPEHCDDANTDDGDGCSATCQVEAGWSCPPELDTACTPICGDGAAKGDEGCDDGGTESGDGCDADCQPEDGWACPAGGGACVASCGDGALDAFEGCDDGNLTGGDGCSTACQTEPGFVCAEAGVACVTVCGDGVPVLPEHCDDGNTDDGDGCSATCQVEAGWDCPLAEEDAEDVTSVCAPRCGDSYVIGGETCDDGNTDDGDGCSAACVPEEGWTCGAPGVACVQDPVCGNGEVEDGEGCDDGNTDDGDGCSAACTVEVAEPECGNDVLENDEQCDDGNTDDGDGCSAACEVEPACGDGTVDEGEDCDDGNTDDGDGCSAACELEPACGDGTVDDGEDCDDGNTDDGDGCSATCEDEVPAPTCGNGEVEEGEDCDDGNLTDFDGCSRDCQGEQPPECGNSVVEGGDGGEECDDGNTDDGDGCSATCTNEPICGNGEVEVGESCDDGDTVSGDGCSAECVDEGALFGDLTAKGGSDGCAGGSSGAPWWLVLALAGVASVWRRSRRSLAAR